MAAKFSNDIIHLIKDCIRNKLKNYKRESNNMPFHYRLLGQDRMALYSFIQSLNTTFGTSIFEPVAVQVAKRRFKYVEQQYQMGREINETAQKIINNIIYNLSVGEDARKEKEIEAIRKACAKGRSNKIKTVKVDLLLEDKDGQRFLIDLKTAKPNSSNFKDLKKTLLEWIAIEITKDSKAKVSSLIAIPYNPYEPKPYQRWTLKGMLDLKKELLVGKEFWDFLGGEGSYEKLLDCFEKAGIELKSEIDQYFEKFK